MFITKGEIVDTSILKIFNDNMRTTETLLSLSFISEKRKSYDLRCRSVFVIIK